MDQAVVDELIAALAKWLEVTEFEQAVGIIDRLCEAYRRADDVQRDAIRKAVRQCRDVYALFFYDSVGWVGSGSYLTWVAKVKGEQNYSESLSAGLTAVSITGGFGDSRDTLLWLDKLWDAAEYHGIDPRPFFRSIAEISDTTQNRLDAFGGSTKGLILLLLEYSPHTGKPRSGIPAAKHVPQTSVSEQGKTKRKPWWKFW
jgi:hypothetical protein